MKRTAAFTLVELLVVITLIATLAGMALSGLSSIREASKRHVTQLILDKVDAALRAFRTDTGFYPKGAYAYKPLKEVTSGWDRGLIDVNPTTKLPRTDNDDIWAPTGTPTTWANGNGLGTMLGTKLTDDERQTAITNANSMRAIELDRMYHIGSFGNTACTGLSVPGGFVRIQVGDVTSSPACDWALYDATEATTLGERELKWAMGHYRIAPVVIDRTSDPWQSAAVSGKVADKFRDYLVVMFQKFVNYARQRDATDAYLRSMRNGTTSGNIAYNSAFDNTGIANGSKTYNKSKIIAKDSIPWTDDYLKTDISPRHRVDIDGDNKIDIIDDYNQPLIYINAGLPARPQVECPLTTVTRNPVIPITGGDGELNQCGTSSKWKGWLLLYHPDPNLEDTKWISAGGPPNTSFMFVTDRPNTRGVPVRADAEDIALIDGSVRDSSGNPQVGSSWIWARHGINMLTYGDPYRLAGTLVPSRIAVRTTPTNIRAGEVYYCLSSDKTKLVEPWQDEGGGTTGTWDNTEPYYDRTRNGVYDTNIADYDIRICAPIGTNRDFSLVSAGRDGAFHALIPHAANRDNTYPQTTGVKP